MLNLKTNSPSCPERLGNWIPSLSFPKVPSWNSCKEAFHSLTNRFQSQPRPISERDVEDISDLHPSENISQEALKDRNKVLIIAVASVTVLCVASYEVFQYLYPQNSELNAQSTNTRTKNLSLAIAASAPLTQALSEAVQNVMQSAIQGAMQNSTENILQEIQSSFHNAGRSLLSTDQWSLANASANLTVAGTEEIPLVRSSSSFNTWDVFPNASQGRFIVSTDSQLPPGLSLVQSPIKILNTLEVPSTGLIVSKGNTLYAPSSQTASVQIINADSVEEPFINKIFDSGIQAPVLNIFGEKLFITGNNTLVKTFDISNPFKPVFEREALNANVIGRNLVLSETTNQIGCITNNGFFYLDANTLSVTGIIQSISGFRITASEDCFFVQTQTGLLSLSTTPSSSSIGFFPITNILNIHYENGFCYVSSGVTGLIILDVTDPANMQQIYLSPTRAYSFLSLGNLLYYGSYPGAIGIFDKTNLSNPIIAADNLLPGLESAGSLLSVGENLIYKRGSLAHFITQQDSFSIVGTPEAGSEGSYQITLTATTLTGEVIEQTRIIDFTILPAITSLPFIQDFVAAVDQLFTATLPNIFKHVKGLPLTLDYECSPNEIKEVISLVNGQLSGIPRLSDLGTRICIIQAIDPFGASATTLPRVFKVIHGIEFPTIPLQTAVVDEEFSLDLIATSREPNTTFSFTATNLLASLRLTNRTIKGIPTNEDLGTNRISVSVKNQHGITVSQAVPINVIQPGSPIFYVSLQPMIAYIGERKIIPIDIEAVNYNNPKANISYVMTLQDGRPLPKWMLFQVLPNGKKLIVNPPIDTKVFFDVTLAVSLIGIQTFSNGQEQSRAVTSGEVTIAGTTLLQKFLGVVSASPFVYFFYRRRITIYNSSPKLQNCIAATKNCLIAAMCFCGCCRKCRPEKSIPPHREVIIVKGQGISHKFKTDQSLIASFQTIFNEKGHCPEGNLPTGFRKKLSKDGNFVKVIGSPDAECIQDKKINEITITAFDNTVTALSRYGYMLEKITFIKEGGSVELLSPPKSTNKVHVEDQDES